MGFRATIAIAVVAIFLAVCALGAFRLHTQGVALREAQAAAAAANSALQTRVQTQEITGKVADGHTKRVAVIEKRAEAQEIKLKEALNEHQDVSSIVLPDDIIRSLR